MNNNDMEKVKKEMLHVTTIVQKWGNSLGVRIPKFIADSLNVKEGTELEVSVENGAIKFVPLRKKPSLGELMARITPENQHDEIDWGTPEGNEVW